MSLILLSRVTSRRCVDDCLYEFKPLEWRRIRCHVSVRSISNIPQPQGLGAYYFQIHFLSTRNTRHTPAVVRDLRRHVHPLLGDFEINCTGEIFLSDVSVAVKFVRSSAMGRRRLANS